MGGRSSLLKPLFILYFHAEKLSEKSSQALWCAKHNYFHSSYVLPFSESEGISPDLSSATILCGGGEGRYALPIFITVAVISSPEFAFLRAALTIPSANTDRVLGGDLDNSSRSHALSSELWLTPSESRIT